jgi:hypothetical protein
VKISTLKCRRRRKFNPRWKTGTLHNSYKIFLQSDIESINRESTCLLENEYIMGNPNEAMVQVSTQ